MGDKPKRLRDLTPGVSTRDAARVAVGRRIKKARRRIPEAVEGDEQRPEAVHKLRTSCRRATAALDAFAPCLPKKPRKKARKKLETLRRAAGDARDLDVQAELWRRLAREEPSVSEAVDAMLGHNRARRREAGDQIRAIASGISAKKLKKSGKKLKSEAGEARLEDRTLENLGELAHERLNALADDLRKRLGQAPLTPQALHKARIEAKRLRYAFEIFRRCLDQGLAAQLGEDMKALHDALGSQHDLIVARGLLDELEEAEEMPPEVTRPLRGVVDDRLMEAHQRALEELERFGEVWLKTELRPAA
jgi:CHAD domain-containing protein